MVGLDPDDVSSQWGGKIDCPAVAKAMRTKEAGELKRRPVLVVGYRGAFGGLLYYQLEDPRTGRILARRRYVGWLRQLIKRFDLQEQEEVTQAQEEEVSEES